MRIELKDLDGSEITNADLESIHIWVSDYDNRGVVFYSGSSMVFIVEPEIHYKLVDSDPFDKDEYAEIIALRQAYHEAFTYALDVCLQAVGRRQTIYWNELEPHIDSVLLQKGYERFQRCQSQE